MQTLTIGQAAREAGIGVETIRYYERQGLVESPARTRSGYRRFTPDVIRRLRFIQRAKRLGFTLSEIGDLLALRVDPGTSCADVRRRTAHKIAEVDERIIELRRMRGALAALASECSGRGPLAECPILDALDRAEESNAED
jgi:MerR family mercuric resistance operon transcriptional regulator